MIFYNRVAKLLIRQIEQSFYTKQKTSEDSRQFIKHPGYNSMDTTFAGEAHTNDRNVSPTALTAKWNSRSGRECAVSPAI